MARSNGPLGGPTHHFLVPSAVFTVFTNLEELWFSRFSPLPGFSQEADGFVQSNKWIVLFYVTL